MKLEWTEPAKANDEVRYDHTKAETPFGRFLLTWKGWKEYPDYGFDETPWGEAEYKDWNTVADAQRWAETEMEKRCLEATGGAKGYLELAALREERTRLEGVIDGLHRQSDLYLGMMREQRREVVVFHNAAIRLFNSGKTLNEISEIFGVSIYDLTFLTRAGMRKLRATPDLPDDAVLLLDEEKLEDGPEGT